VVDCCWRVGGHRLARIIQVYVVYGRELWPGLIKGYDVTL
jgi:hypothetical protein